MKAASIFFFGALVCSVAAAPRPLGRRFGNQGKSPAGGFGKGGAPPPPKGGAGASSAIASASIVTSAAPAATSALTGNNAGAGGAATGGDGDLQTSLTLDSSVICANFTDDGQNPPVAGQSASSTSTNNYINFCALTLPQTPLTNGLQITSGSCNPAPIGLIPSVDHMPSAKYLFPKNGGTIPANQAFNAQLNVLNFHTGVFTNAQKTYFAAPQTLDAQGLIIGHSHMVIEALSSIDQITPTDPQKFIFFKGVDAAAVNGVLTVAVTAGVPPGTYRICSINSSSNHQPVIVPIAQHGSLDDCSYFTAK
ncbi:hypothetical protein B0H17DRAFT_995841 [Mycena rosella]|uniref:Uncharacterized protein n=1 Tax=Mycena rosella TaxID=1033263 RepID=A0AAD7BSH1_MYCRO|nr:hypothetical protein B0H17DRAFT_995841 [Mycena rosella]